MILNTSKNFYFGVILILSTSHNSIITVTNLKGNVIFTYSTGHLGIKGSKRSSSYASQNLGFFIGKKLTTLGLKYLYVKINGFGPGRSSILKGLYFSRLKILYVFDITKVSFNGCRQSKKRRL
jgi:small subunit ribosomal protein S11